MASRMVSRISSRLQPVAHKLSNNQSSATTSLLRSASQSAARRTSWISRLPVELSSVDTMLPLHSAIAAARLRSSLSLESQTWGLVPQGISLPL